MPKGRTTQYAIWLACERARVIPPDVKAHWEDNSAYMQAELIAFSQIRSIEESESCVCPWLQKT